VLWRETWVISEGDQTKKEREGKLQNEGKESMRSSSFDQREGRERIVSYCP